MKKVLVVAYYFPPIAASGALRPLGFCRYLALYDWLPSVLTIEPACVFPLHGVDDGLRLRVPAGLHIEAVRYQNPLHRLLRFRRWARDVLSGRPVAVSQPESALGNGSMKPRANGRGRLSHGLGFLKNLILTWSFEFPDPQCFWYRAAMRRMARLPEEQRPDLIFATGGPWTNFLIGRALARYFSVPLVVDFRDPWTNNPYGPFTSRFLAGKAKRLERSICLAAARIVTNTRELASHLCKEYPGISERTVTISNGFDDELCLHTDENTVSEEILRSNAGQPKVELWHFGTIYGRRSPVFLFQALKDLIAEEGIGPEHIRLRFVGSWDGVDDQCERLAGELENAGCLVREPPVPRDQCLRQMSMAPILLVLQPGSPLQIPGKIYEYIGCRRPILVIGDEGATTRLVMRYRFGLCCRYDVSEIRGVLLGLAQGRGRLEVPTPSLVGRFHYRSLTRQLAETFEAARHEAEVARSVLR